MWGGHSCPLPLIEIRLPRGSWYGQPSTRCCNLRVNLPVLCGIRAAQDVAQEKAAQKDIDLVTIGNGHLPDGTKTAFRVYRAPDGTDGKVNYTEFDSLEPAELQIEKWVKATRTVTSREHNQTKGDQLISDRVLGVTDLPKSDKKEFVIIRRDYLKCYLIESVSLQVAMQIEGLIGHK
jgi:hypothetical protein